MLRSARQRCDPPMPARFLWIAGPTGTLYDPLNGRGQSPERNAWNIVWGGEPQIRSLPTCSVLRAWMQLSRRLKKRSTCRIDFNRNRQPRQRVDRTSHFGDLSKFLSTCHSRSSTICSNLGSATSSKSSIPLRHTSACCQESPLEYISRLAKIVQKTFSNVTARQVTMVSPRAPLQHFAYTGGLFSSQMRVFKHCPVAVSQMRLRKKWAIIQTLDVTGAARK